MTEPGILEYAYPKRAYRAICRCGYITDPRPTKAAAIHDLDTHTTATHDGPRSPERNTR